MLLSAITFSVLLISTILHMIFEDKASAPRKWRRLQAKENEVLQELLLR